MTAPGSEERGERVEYAFEELRGSRHRHVGRAREIVHPPLRISNIVTPDRLVSNVHDPRTPVRCNPDDRAGKLESCRHAIIFELAAINKAVCDLNRCGITDAA